MFFLKHVRHCTQCVRILELSTLPSKHIYNAFLWQHEINQCYYSHWLLWEQQDEFAFHLCICGHDIDVPMSFKLSVQGKWQWGEGSVCLSTYISENIIFCITSTLSYMCQCPSNIATPPGSSGCFLDHAKSNVACELGIAACRISACMGLPLEWVRTQIWRGVYSLVCY